MKSKLDSIDQALKEMSYNGVISIIHNQKVMMSNAYGYGNFEHKILLTSNSPMRIASLTKQVTAVAILQLLEQNKLDVKDTVKKYFSDYPRGDEITLHDLLTHTSGVANFPLDMDFYPVLNSDSVLDALIDLFKYKPLDFNPGEKFSYSVSGFLLLQYVIEKVSGLSYEAYVKKNVFDPLEMKHSGYDHYRNIIKNRANPYDFENNAIKNAHFVDMKIAGAGGGLYASLEDLEKFNLGLLKDQIMKSASRELMFSHQYEIVEDVYSGYGIFIQTCEHFNKRRIKAYHAGGGPGVRGMNIFLPDDNLSIIMLSNVNDANTFNACLNKVEATLLE